MKVSFLFVIAVYLLCSEALTDDIGHSANKCDEYADIPEPPCCGTPFSLEGRIRKEFAIPVPDEEVPYFVRVGGGHGALINSRWVLTCAHCIANNHQVGRVNVKVRRKVIPADFWILHPLHGLKGTGLLYDIALVRLKEPVVITNSNQTQPICLPISTKFNTMDFTGKNVTVLGFQRGVVNGKVVRVSKAIQPVLPKANCSSGLGKERLCTKHVTEKGDSGNAVSMLANYNALNLNARYIVGIVSSSTDYNSRFVRIDAFTDWIKAVIWANKD